jgi:DNA invertase Pin-like site-specific DNA recombinase
LCDLITMLDDLRAHDVLISERTRAGVWAGQRRGVKFGRKVKLTPERVDHARSLIEKGEAREYAADLLKTGRSMLYRVLNSATEG